jgi:hypothetical protein
LYRVFSGRGWVDVDYGGLRGRIEVTVTVPLASAEGAAGEEQHEVFVLVSRRKGDAGVKERGVGWLEVALDARGLPSGTLVVFDHRGKERPAVKLRETTTAKGRTVRVLRA